MGDRKFTLVELHADGEPQFGPRSIGSLPMGASEGAETESDEEAAAADEESGGRSAVGVVVGLLALVGIALAIRRLRGGGDEDAEAEYEEPDVVVG